MDPSGSFEADQASGQSWQTEDNIGMEPVYYKGFKNIEKSPINQLLTPNRNTVLHIYLTSLIKRSEESESKDSKSTEFVIEILSVHHCYGKLMSKVKLPCI